jgi:uncharacterized protein (TIGR03086 family)
MSPSRRRRLTCMTTDARGALLDFQPATEAVTRIVTGVRDDQLTAPTPCPQATVGDLLDHVDGLSLAFAAAARKEGLDGSGGRASADASRLGGDWRIRIPRRLAALAAAWRDEAAWTGMTRAGGVDLPGEVAGVVALDEVIVHGWDIAVATGQPFSVPAEHVQAANTFVQASVARNPQGSPGLFGPPVPVPADASPLDQLIGLTGRDPAWQAAAAATDHSLDR